MVGIAALLASREERRGVWLSDICDDVFLGVWDRWRSIFAKGVGSMLCCFGNALPFSDEPRTALKQRL